MTNHSNSLEHLCHGLMGVSWVSIGCSYLFDVLELAAIVLAIGASMVSIYLGFKRIKQMDNK